jgi:hypothetical protein
VLVAVLLAVGAGLGGQAGARPVDGTASALSRHDDRPRNGLIVFSRFDPATGDVRLFAAVGRTAAGCGP